MKTNKIYLLLLSAVMLLVTVGCTDRLDIAKHGNISDQDAYYKTDAEAEAAVASLYLSWRAQYKNFFYLVNSLSDDVWAAGGARGDNRPMEQANEFNFDSNHVFIKDSYTELYKLIYNANLIIDLVEPNSDIKKRAIAEAKFFRAYAYFQLITMWGPVAKVDHVLKPSEYHQANSSVEDLWIFVEQDFMDAIEQNALPSKSHVLDKETGMRVTREVAKAFLGKAYLFQRKYKDAANILDEVIDSNLYGLYGIAEVGEYEDILHVPANNCCESMLECQMRNDADQAWNQQVDLYCAMGWRATEFEYTNESIAGGTWGFLTPRKDLYNAFVEMEGTDGYRLMSSLRTRAQLATFGVKLKYTTLVGNEGVFSWKYRTLKSDLIYENAGFQVLQYINLHVMRYAEVLLLAAEAHVMSGNQAKATEYLNEIRLRAHLMPKSNITLDDIKKEKRLELCMESTRYQDLVRWGDAAVVLKEQGKTIPAFTLKRVEIGEDIEIIDEDAYTNTVYGFQEKHNLLPFPAAEMQVNPNMKQNPGWE